ncbi:hypothetical protein K432DRAFT_386960 [Lepidopterella palustris CBS 459.81]|uniref:Uncharacterized protein n=1 Tax=Lepidopterella palustris CBS 459.81 TaxID=1314670 RepID=A0A8E2J9B2_9PEZI|nr:hypothetical protein K432DRAFT_386960 [Lepidopterella palustris CBS 459.81]
MSKPIRIESRHEGTQHPVLCDVCRKCIRSGEYSRRYKITKDPRRSASEGRNVRPVLLHDIEANDAEQTQVDI